MKKVFVFILLLLLPGSLLAQVVDHTNIHADQGNTSYIDWPRILGDFYPEARIMFRLVNQIQFEGTIHNSKPLFGTDKITKIVRDVMIKENITDGMLRGIDEDLANHANITSKEWYELAGAAVDMALRSGVNPYGSEYAITIDGIRSQLGSLSGDQMMQQGMDDVCGYLQGKALSNMADMTIQQSSNMMFQQGAKSAFGWIMIMAGAVKLGWDLGEFDKKYHISDRADYNAKIMDRLVKKELFYNTVKERLEKALEDYYKDGEWIIEVKPKDVVRQGATLFNAPITQKWKMEARLVKEKGGKSFSRFGVYTGRMKITATHEKVNEFDAQFKKNVLLSKDSELKELEPLCAIHDKPTDATTLGDKVVDSEAMRVEIKKGENKRDWHFTGSLKEHEAPFHVNHEGEFNLVHGIYNDGKFERGPLKAEVNYKFSFYGKSTGNDGRWLAIIMTNQRKTDYGQAVVPRFKFRMDLTHTMKNFKTGLIMEDRKIFRPLGQAQGHNIWEQGEVETLRRSSPHYVQPQMPPVSEHEPVPMHDVLTAPGGPVEEDANGLMQGEDGLWHLDWKKDLPDKEREMVERGDAIIASGQLPEPYRSLLPEGLQSDDQVVVSDSMLTVAIKMREGITFDDMVRRVEGSGFTGEITLPGKQYDGNGNGKEVMVSFAPETDYLVVLIEDEKVSEAEQTASKIERLTKRMEEINKEIQAHPEKAEELQEELLDISIELQEESLKIQEDMLNQ